MAGETEGRRDCKPGIGISSGRGGSVGRSPAA